MDEDEMLDHCYECSGYGDDYSLANLVNWYVTVTHVRVIHSPQIGMIDNQIDVW